MTETIQIIDSYNDIKPGISIHSTEHLIQEARIAVSLVERWGMVQAKDGGEDSSGRARLELMPVDEVVARACDTAALLMAEVRNRNWVVPVPSWEEVEAEVKRKEIERRASRR